MKNLSSIAKQDVKENNLCIEPQVIDDKNKLGDLLVSIDSNEEIENYITVFEEFIQMS